VILLLCPAAVSLCADDSVVVHLKIFLNNVRVVPRIVVNINGKPCCQQATSRRIGFVKNDRKQKEHSFFVLML